MSKYQQKKMNRHYRKALKLVSMSEAWAGDGALFSAAARLEEAAAEMKKAAVAKNKMLDNLMAGR